MSLAVIVALLSLTSCFECTTTQNSSAVRLHVLAVLSTNGGDNVPKWERGSEILPGGLAAVDEINNNPSILDGYHIELVPLMVPMCDPIEGTSMFVELISSQEYNIVGVIGLFCTRLADSISPLAGYEGIDLIQLSGSTAYHPEDDSRSTSRHLFHMLPSSEVYARALIALMEELGWTKIGVIHSSQGHHDTYYTRTREILANVLARGVIDVKYLLDSNNVAPLRDLQTSGIKVVFVLAPPRRSAEILCSAYLEGLRWPKYAWILAELEVRDFSSNTAECDNLRNEILDKVFVINYKIDVNVSTVLHNSATTYEEYLLTLSQFTTNQNSTPNSYANVLYDSVWSLALGINASLKVLSDRNLTIANYGLGNREITEIVEPKVKMLSFLGASGYVTFEPSSNGAVHHITVIPVAISQIQNGKVIRVGSYNDSTRTLNLNESVGKVPTDALERVYVLYPPLLHIPLSVLIILCIVFTTGSLILYFYYRSEPVIKATSTFLSLCIFVGCYITLTAALIHTLISGFAIPTDNQAVSALLCVPRSFFAVIGFDLILATIVAKTLRIYHVFSTFARTSRLWSNRGLGILIAVIVSIKVVIAIAWAAFDVYHLVDNVSLQRPTASDPYYRVTQDCYSRHTTLWLAVVYGYTGLLLLGLLILAFKTRKIRMENFKDTKKINVLIIVLIFDICVCVSLLVIFRLGDNVIGSRLTVSIGYPLGAMACMCLLFIPKIAPPLQRDVKGVIKLGIRYRKPKNVRLLRRDRSSTVALVHNPKDLS